MKSISQSAAWRALAAHQQQLIEQSLPQLFAADSKRFEHFSFQLDDLVVDFSKQYINTETLRLLLELAEQAGLQDKINDLFAGELVNGSEQRAAMHMALRNQQGEAMQAAGNDVTAVVQAELNKMSDFVTQVRAGEWHGFSGKAITDVVNVGVGGSDLGPAMACQALKPQTEKLKVHFVSAMDAQQAQDLCQQLNPETTLFIVVSKTFTTLDTLVNATILRDWFNANVTAPNALQHHFVAVSSNQQAAQAFGIVENNVFKLWDWVGGRYSLWSSVGLAIALYCGMDVFKQLLAGASLVDQHFHSTPLAKNIPVIMGLLSVWYINFFHCGSQAVLPYDSRLQKFPAFLQQLDMESCGKRVTTNGEVVDYATGSVIFGDVGTNAQHAFMQLLHQGTQIIPVDFIVPMQVNGKQDQVNYALANALAQSMALMQGQNGAENFQHYPGNKPSTMFLFPKLTAKMLGILIALYEHKIFVQSAIWHINPFDQWGVELGKQNAKKFVAELSTETNRQNSTFDDSSKQLISLIKRTLA